MCERAIYLQKAIDLYTKEQHFYDLSLSRSEWKRIEILLDVLDLFKRCSDRMEATNRPGIEKVFWIYEKLFNDLDRLAEQLDDATGEEERCLDDLISAYDAMRSKLSKYYSGTGKPGVYGDAMILDPCLKLHLTKSPEWSGGQTGEYSGQGYSRACRRRFIEDYQKSEIEPEPTVSHVRKRPSASITADEDDFEQMLSSLPRDSISNEYDIYINAPRSNEKGDILQIWRRLSKTEYVRLGLMVRDILAVPATGAGVERQFSKSGKVETAYRARINPITTSDIMMYKDYLKRRGKALSEIEVAMGANEEEVNIDDLDVPREWRRDWFNNHSAGRRTL